MTITETPKTTDTTTHPSPTDSPATEQPATDQAHRLSETPEGTSTMTMTIDPKPPSLTATDELGTPVALSTSAVGLPSPLAESWWTAAACREVPDAGELFFSEELQDIAAAKLVCAECPAIAPCLEGAITRAEPWGVWGGQLFLNGKILARKRRRGRPPKNPRPEDQIPDIPVPAHLQKLIA